jgi:hypothetical protein
VNADQREALHPAQLFDDFASQARKHTLDSPLIEERLSLGTSHSVRMKKQKVAVGADNIFRVCAGVNVTKQVINFEF